VAVRRPRLGAVGDRGALRRAPLAPAERRAQLVHRHDVVEVEADADHAVGPGAVEGGDDQRQRLHEVRRERDHDLTLEQRLADEAEVEVLQVAQAAVDELARAARGAGGEVVALDERDAVPARGRVERDAGAGDPAADHDDVEAVGRQGAQGCGSVDHRPRSVTWAQVPAGERRCATARGRAPTDGRRAQARGQVMESKGKRLVALGLATAGLLVVPSSAAWSLPLPEVPALPDVPVDVPPLPPLPVVDVPPLPPVPVDLPAVPVDVPPVDVAQPPLPAPALPDPGSVVGGIVDHTAGTVLDGGRGALPDDAVTTLLQLYMPATAGAAGGDAGAAAGDAVAPHASVAVLSRLRHVARTGVLRLLVGSDEPGIVVVKGSVRPGPAVRGRGRSHTRRLVRFQARVVPFRLPGKVQVRVKLPRAARIALGRSRNARLNVATIAADLQRNQRTDYVVRQVKR
jgi:hypothetical protein